MSKKTTILLIMAALLALMAACDRYIESRDPVRSLPSPLDAPLNVQVTLDNETVTLSWEVTDTSAVNRFRVYTADSADGEYVLRDSTFAYSTTVTGLLVNRAYYFTVAGVTSSGAEGYRSTPVTAPVGLLSITIEGKDKYTGSRDVQIQLYTSSSTSHVILSEDPLFADAMYEPFSSVKRFTLSQVDGVKTVYARYIFGDGSRTGRALSDDIILDTRVRIDSVYFAPAGQVFATGDTIVFSVDAGEPDGEARAGFTGAETITLYDDGSDGDVAANDGVYTARYIVPNELVADGVQVYGDFIDGAGNSASRATSTELLTIEGTALPPEPVVLAATLANDSTIHLTWSRSTADDFESYRLYRSASSIPDPPGEDLLREFINGRTTDSYDDFVPDPGTYYYRIYVFDTQGLSAASNQVNVTK